jgi:hypothetical protein
MTRSSTLSGITPSLTAASYGSGARHPGLASRLQAGSHDPFLIRGCQRARRRGTTTSHVIREAVDAYLAQPESDDERVLQRYREALEAAFGAAPDLPHGSAYVGQLRAADMDRTARLEERRKRRQRA